MEYSFDVPNPAAIGDRVANTECLVEDVGFFLDCPANPPDGTILCSSTRCLGLRFCLLFL